MQQYWIMFKETASDSVPMIHMQEGDLVSGGFAPTLTVDKLGGMFVAVTTLQHEPGLLVVWSAFQLMRLPFSVPVLPLFIRAAQV